MEAKRIWKAGCAAFSGFWVRLSAGIIAASLSVRWAYHMATAMNDTLTFSQWVSREWGWIISLGDSPYFWWAVAAVSLAMLARGIRLTIKAQYRAAKLSERAAKDLYQPVLTKIQDDVEHVTGVLRDVSRYFAMDRHYKEAVATLQDLERTHAENERNFKREPFDGTRLDDWPDNEFDLITKLGEILHPYRDGKRIDRDVSEITLSTVSLEGYQNVPIEYRARIAEWIILKQRADQYVRLPMKYLKSQTASVGKRLENLGDRERKKRRD